VGDGRGLRSISILDNAKAIRRYARVSGQYGIEDWSYRPVRTPSYGGHIERLIGTMMGRFQLLPGNGTLLQRQR